MAVYSDYRLRHFLPQTVSKKVAVELTLKVIMCELLYKDESFQFLTLTVLVVKRGKES